MTDEAGTLMLDHLPSQETALVAFPTTACPDLTVCSAGQRVLPRGQRIVLRLRRGEAIRGSVIDAEGRPVHRALVFARAGRDEQANTYSDPGGRFRLAVAPDRLYELTAQTSDGKQTDRISHVPPGDGEILMQLLPGH